MNIRPFCKTVNWANTLGWLRGMLSVNKKSHVIRHVLTLRIFGAPKKLCFRRNREEVFNWLNSTNWVELHKGHMQRSQGEITCGGHVQGACKLPGVICIYKWAEFNGANSSRVKRRCQLIVRLKAIKCYEGLFCYLSSSTSGLLLIAVTALFVTLFLGLQEVERRKHFHWNPNPVQDKPLGKTRGSWTSTPWGWCTKQVRGIFLPFDTLRLSCLLSRVPNRSGGLFYPLILLRFNSKRSTKQVRKDYSTFRHFYGLARHAKHQIGQEGLFLILYGWVFTFSFEW